MNIDGSSLQSDGAINDTLQGNHPHGSVDKIQFIVVGPFTEDAKKTTGDLLHSKDEDMSDTLHEMYYQEHSSNVKRAVVS